MTPNLRLLAVLLLPAALVLAGCTDAGSGGQFAGDNGDSEIGAQEALSFRLPAEQQFQLSYDVGVSQGPNIDIMVMTEQNFQRYEGGETFEWIGDCSQMDTGSAAFDCRLPAGTFYLVLDNSDRGEARPATVSTEDQAAAVTYTWEGSY